MDGCFFLHSNMDGGSCVLRSSTAFARATTSFGMLKKNQQLRESPPPAAYACVRGRQAQPPKLKHGVAFGPGPRKRLGDLLRLPCLLVIARAR